MTVATIKGRELEVALPNQVQMVLMQRFITRVENESLDTKDRITSISRLLDVIENLVVNQVDRDWLVEGMLNGSVDIAELTAVVDAIADGMKAAANPEEVKAPVRRGRPKRT